MSPAGRTVHHNYVRGLTEHTGTTMLHATHISGKYPALLDRDLPLTGSFLHDIGKLREISGGMTRGYGSRALPYSGGSRR
jgi:3'-5' exoribonuclease